MGSDSMTGGRLGKLLLESVSVRGILRCPDCRCAILGTACSGCGRSFLDTALGILDFTPRAKTPTKENIAAFWGDLYTQLYSDDDKKRGVAELLNELALLEDLFVRREHLAVCEMELERLAGKRVLEIGSGGGGHSALFRKYGADVVAVDYTPERVASTQHKFELLADVHPGSGIALRADAECLPFEDNSFDIVYSNGVLHHTTDTVGAVSEVHRVLRPAGDAIVMLYSRHSAHYWLHLLPRALVTGLMMRLPEHEWVGRLTEGVPQYQEKTNPITRVYSYLELRQLFRDFHSFHARKHSFLFEHLPIPRAPKLRVAVLKRLGFMEHPAGRIVYGRPIIPEVKLESMLGKLCGFSWNIRATKASN